MLIFKQHDIDTAKALKIAHATLLPADLLFIFLCHIVLMYISKSINHETALKMCVRQSKVEVLSISSHEEMEKRVYLNNLKVENGFLFEIPESVLSK